MFDLIDDRKRLEIKWWTVPAEAFILFATGVDVGILIGRRDADPFDWLQAVFLIFGSLAILLRVVRELMRRHTEERTRQDAR